MSWAFFNLWLRFLLWPIGFVPILGLVEFVRPGSEGALNKVFLFVVKVSVALTGYAIGSIVPYIYSDEYLFIKYATVRTEGENVSFTFGNVDKDKFDVLRNILVIFFITGLVFLIANYIVPEQIFLRSFAYPVWALLLACALIGFVNIAYFLLAGFLYVLMRRATISK